MAPVCAFTIMSRNHRLKPWCGPFWRPADGAAHPAKSHLSGDPARRFSQGYRWARRRLPPGAGRTAPQWCRVCLPQPLEHGAQNPLLRWTGILAVHQTPVTGALPLVATHRGPQLPPVGPRAGGSPVEWLSLSGRHGPGLESTELRLDEIGVIIPRQPRCWVAKDLGAVFL